MNNLPFLLSNNLKVEPFGMLSLPGHRAKNNPYLRDAGYTILFSILSIALSKVQFHIPGVGYSNLREIPFLISLFHFTNPVFIIGLSLSMLVSSPSAIPNWAVFAVHVVPLFIAWIAFKQLQKRQLSDVLSGIVWMVITVAYYLVLLLPMVVLGIQLLASKYVKGFLDSYFSILPSLSFEIIASSLVTGLYLMQLEIKKTLEHNNKNLEKIVETRTAELTAANNELLSLNQELQASNGEIKELNENLEKMVKERTDKIREQFSQLAKYAHMNSHEVRAPLARMLGLLELIKRENDVAQLKVLIGLLHDSSGELDVVIKEMNRLLEKEVYIP